MPWSFISPVGASVRERNPTLSQAPTHNVVVTYDGCLTDMAPVYRGTYQQCVDYIATHRAPAGCHLDIKSLRTGRLVSYVVGA